MTKGTKILLTILFSIILCIFAFGFILYITSDAPDPDTAILSHPYYISKVAEFEEENKTLSDVDIAFVGDSITDGYEPYGTAYSEYKVAWRGIGGDTTVGLKARLDVSLYAVNPKVIVLLIGINNIEKMFNDYESIISEIKTNLPETEIIIQSLHPTSMDLSSMNGRIGAANKRIKEISDKYGCTYVDMNTPLTDSATGQYSELYTDDGLHPNGVGYEKITEILLPVIKEKLDK